MRHCTKSCQRANDRATRRRNIGSHTGPHAQHRQQLQPKSYSAAAAATRTDGCRQTSYTLCMDFCALPFQIWFSSRYTKCKSVTLSKFYGGMHGVTFHVGRPMSLFQKFLFNDTNVIDRLDNVKQHCCNVLVAVLSTTRIGKHRNFSNGLGKALQVLKHTGTYFVTAPFALNFRPR